MSGCCQATYTSKDYCTSNDTCVICRSYPSQDVVKLKPGVMYPACSIVTKGAGPCDPWEPIATPDQGICGLVEGCCGIDLTAETEPCPSAILTKNVIIDPNLVNWPEGWTQEDVDCAIQNSKCCMTFTPRTECTTVPECYADQVTEAKVQAKSAKGATAVKAA